MKRTALARVVGLVSLVLGLAPGEGVNGQGLPTLCDQIAHPRLFFDPSMLATLQTNAATSHQGIWLAIYLSMTLLPLVRKGR